MFRIYTITLLILTNIIFANKISDSIDLKSVEKTNFTEFSIGNKKYLVLLSVDFTVNDTAEQFSLTLYKANNNDYTKIASKSFGELENNESNLLLSKTKDNFFERKLLKCIDINDTKKFLFLPMVYNYDKSVRNYGVFLIENESIYFLKNFSDVKSISKIKDKIILKTSRFGKEFNIILNDYVSDFKLFELNDLKTIDVKEITKYESYTFNYHNKKYAVIYLAKDYKNNTHDFIDSYDISLYRKNDDKYEKIDSLQQSLLPKHIKLGIINYKSVYKVKNIVPFFNNKIFKMKIVNDKPTIIFPIFFGESFNVAIFTIENNKIIFKEEISDIKSIIEEKQTIKISFHDKNKKTLIL